MRNQDYSFAKRNIETTNTVAGWGIFSSMRKLPARLPKMRSGRGYGSRKSAYYMQDF